MATLFGWSVLVAGGVAAVHALTGWPWPMMLPIAAITVFMLALLTVLHVNGKHAEAIGVHVAKELAYVREHVHALNVATARQRALAMLANPCTCTVTRSTPSDPAALEQLGPELRRFFSEFERLDEPITLDRNNIGPASFPGMLVIGDPYGFGHDEIAVKPGDDTIYLLDLEEPVEERQPDRLAESIWHVILLEAIKSQL